MNNNTFSKARKRLNLLENPNVKKVFPILVEHENQEFTGSELLTRLPTMLQPQISVALGKLLRQKLLHLTIRGKFHYFRLNKEQYANVLAAIELLNPDLTPPNSDRNEK